MKLKIIAALIFISGCMSSKKISNVDAVLNRNVSGNLKIPDKENFYIFILAGQSNMAGRGTIEAEDTLVSEQVLTLNGQNEWQMAKEPLHYYEPSRAGLDCGLSFGKELSHLYGKKITIGLVPVAVGGSSIEQWLGDSTHRNVKLYSNLLKKMKIASQAGTLKGMLWHQGEDNATQKGYDDYEHKVEAFFQKVRNDLQAPQLPIYAGQLGSYLRPATYPNKDSVNSDLQGLKNRMQHFYLIETADLTPMKDTVHFDSRSQRLMGKRFAEAVYKNEEFF